MTTRDEAIEIVRRSADVNRTRQIPGRPTGPTGIKEVDGPPMLVDALVALGLLKLETAAPPRARRCVPPPQHTDKAYHWLRGDSGIHVFSWSSGPELWMATGWTGNNQHSPDEMAERGWSYLGPCRR